MTTPERLRRRQRRESLFIAILAVALCVVVGVYRYKEAGDDRCFDAFLENQSTTSKLRSELVERDSEATHEAIRGAGAATTRDEFEEALAAAEVEWATIAKEREANPVEEFDRKTTC